MKSFEEEHDLVIMQWPQEFSKGSKLSGDESPDRSSPPLYEVELTASDEDDDASVLELVIPMHSSRYQRVPTSSPKKSKPKVVKRYFCSMICCGRYYKKYNYSRGRPAKEYRAGLDSSLVSDMLLERLFLEAIESQH